ncbi:hypothetical protein Pcinc_043355, partial [Petrolisthes cinctipes]
MTNPPSFLLAPTDAPRCDAEAVKVVAVARGEPVNISCGVTSNPPRATYHWRLNGSERTLTSYKDTLSWNQLASHFTFAGNTDKDYGLLHCWANNSVGYQDQPCVFQIMPA